MKPSNPSTDMKANADEICRGFDKVLAGALGTQQIQKILIDSTAPLRNELQSRFDTIASVGLRKKDRIPFKNVKLTFITGTSKTKPNVVRTGPTGPGWQAAHLIEYGTVNRGKTGVMPATPFMRLSVINTKDAVAIKGIELTETAIIKVAKEAGFK